MRGKSIKAFFLAMLDDYPLWIPRGNLIHQHNVDIARKSRENSSEKLMLLSLNDFLLGPQPKSLLTNSGNFPICSRDSFSRILPPDSSIAPGSSVDDQQGPYHLLIQKRLYSRVNPLLRAGICALKCYLNGLILYLGSTLIMSLRATYLKWLFSVVSRSDNKSKYLSHFF